MDVATARRQAPHHLLRSSIQHFKLSTVPKSGWTLILAHTGAGREMDLDTLLHKSSWTAFWTPLTVCCHASVFAGLHYLLHVM